MFRIGLIIFTAFTTLLAFLFLVNTIDMIIRPNYKNLNDSEFVIVALFVSAVVLCDILLLKKFWKRNKRTSNLK